MSSEKRVVLDTPNFLSFCPYAARFPFETWILPKHHNSHYENIQKVNDGILKRIQGVVQNDADLNALIILQSFGDLLTMAISKDLSRIEPLFFRE